MRKLLVGALATLLIVSYWPARTAADPQGSLDPLVVAPSHFTLEFENQHVRVLREHTAGREKIPMHQHAVGGVMVLLTDQDVRQTMPDGTVREVHRKAGETYWADPTTHAGENLTGKPLEFFRIDIKAAAK